MNQPVQISGSSSCPQPAPPRRPLLGLAWLCIVAPMVLLTGGCGGESTLPGGADPGEADPLAAGAPMFYVQRAVTEDGEEDELNNPTRFVGSARLVRRSSSDQNAEEADISARIYSGNYDVRDLDVSFDGNFVLFSMRAPQLENADEDEQPTWNIWEYDIENDQLRRVIPDDITAERGHDINARYLPTGDIVFASTRQQKNRATLLDEGKPAFANLEESRRQPALNLHVMEGDGSEIRQITFNMSHDFYPVVALDGRIIYSRWDRYGRNGVHLYRVNADGTRNELLYGLHSHDSGNNESDFHFIKPGILPDGRVFALGSPMQPPFFGGDILSIDTENYIDNTSPTALTNGSGPAQQSLTRGEVQTDNPISPGGTFADYFPLWDGTSRALVSWSQCRLVLNGKTNLCLEQDLANPAALPATPAYSIWMMDYVLDTQVPVLPSRRGYVYSNVAVAAERDTPQPYYDDDALNGVVEGKISAATYADLKDPQNEEGVIHIRNVYDTDGVVSGNYADWANPSVTNADERPARFLRVIKGVYEPDRDIHNPANGSFGPSNIQRMKEILGYAPIAPDGSVKVRVPANVPLMLSFTDAGGKRLHDRHQNWISLRPGEVMECQGCHQRNSRLPHGRPDAQATTTNPGQPMGSRYPGTNAALISPFDFATMAEALADQTMDTLENSMKLSADLFFEDVWSTGTPLDADLLLSYETMLDSADSDFLYTPPGNANCRPWNARCRIIINYEDHIQPLWEYERTALASDSEPSTCIRCHSLADSLGTAQLPAADLELTGQADGTSGIRNRAYVELFFADVPKVEDDTGSIVDCTQEQPRLDNAGNPILDEAGDPVTDTVLCPASVPAAMSANGARASRRFFDVFASGGSHEGYMTPGELRLIAEWLDIGAQYYNNHFDAPDN